MAQQGIRRTANALASIVAAATSTTLYQISPGREARITKVIIKNRQAVAINLSLGYGDFTQVFPDIFVPSGMTEILTEDMLPEFWFRERGNATADIVGRSSAAAASPNDIQVFLEVEERGPGQ